jgi:hypothetical protein
MARPEYPCGVISIRETEYPLTVDDSGIFSSKIGAKQYHARTRDELHDVMMAETKRASARVSVPFTAVSQRGYDTKRVLRTGVATGIHSSNGNLLIRFDDSRHAEQMDAHRRLGTPRDFYGPDFSQEQFAELERLRRADIEASNALAAFRQEHALDLTQAVRDAVEAAVKADVSK